ncbi:MAG: DNA primase small subunit domain-containing protein [Candidatus Helarchaeota archaeon]
MNKEHLNLRNFLARMFKNYYSTQFKNEYEPSDLKTREFGFTYWLQDTFSRHLGFMTFNELKEHVIRYPPQHVYCSAARYQIPDAPNMKLKSYIDCDLIFDLDIDHIPTSCKEEHDKWICKECGNTGKGKAPSECPTRNCKSKSFKEITWECDKCLKIAKSKIFIIIDDFLANDFGLDPKDDLFIVFSGRRGFHIHVEKEFIRKLDSNARREIVDYITGQGIVPSFHGLNPNAQKKPSIFDMGWRGRIARLVLKLFKETPLDELQQLLTKSVNVREVKEEVISQLTSVNPSWSITKIGEKTWPKIINSAINKFAGVVDEPVSIDTHRLIRLPGSLHGKTGFLVKKLTLSELELFDPFSDPLVFKGTKRVYVKETPPFRIENEIFGPYKNEYVELPLSAAIFLLCRNAATL